MSRNVFCERISPMFESFLLGRYMSGNRFLYKMDPRSKIIMTIMYILLVLISDSLRMLASHAAVAVAAISLSRISFMMIWHSLKGILWLAFVAALFRLFGHPGGEWAIAAFNISIHEEAVRQSILLFGRMIMLIILVSMLTLTTPASDLAYGIAAVIRPLRIFGFPTDRFAFLIVLSLRFLPVFLQEIDQIDKALQARQGGFPRTGPFAAVSRTASLFILAFAHVYRRAEGLSSGLEARGYKGEAGRVRRRIHRFGWRDAVGLIFVAAQSFAAFVTRYSYWTMGTE